MARKVAVIMGSKSDWATMQAAVEILEQMGVEYHTEVVSAHRTPQKLTEFAENAVEQGYAVIIAGAGGAAHLPGMVAAHTRLPVLGVPVQSKALSGVDSLYSIVQMPKGVPVGTLAIGEAGAANALAPNPSKVGAVKRVAPSPTTPLSLPPAKAGTANCVGLTVNV